MSRVSKIPARHQTRLDGLYHSTIYAKSPIPAGLTTPEQADAHRASYRAKCDTRRNGNKLEVKGESGEWLLLRAFKFTAGAKAASSNRRYAV